MKVQIEIECTPEEARQAIGLPDLTPLHDRYVAALSSSLDASTAPEQLERLLRSWLGAGDTGMGLWRKMFETRE